MRPNEWIFPLTALLLTCLVWMPVMTWLCERVLAWRRAHARVWADIGSPTTFMLLVAPTLIPLAWLTSSALHLIESYPALDACALDEEGCQEALILLCLIVVTSLLGSAGRIMQDRAPLSIQPLGGEDPLVRRVHALCARHPLLCALRVSVASHGTIPVFTTGWLRPRVVMDACFVQSADDAMLIATLLHERAHVHHRDGLCHIIARICFTLNPAGAWLRHEYTHWRHAIEARCDHEAVKQGGERLALAQSLVRAAKFECGTSTPCARLCGLTGDPDLSTLKLRIALLLEGGITPTRSTGHLVILALLFGCILMPHLSGTGMLDLLHVEVERLYHLF